MTAAPVKSPAVYRPRPRLDNPPIVRRNAPNQAAVERKTLISAVTRLTCQAGLKSGEVRVIMQEIGDVDGYAHDEGKRNEYLNAVKGNILARQFADPKILPFKRPSSPEQAPLPTPEPVADPLVAAKAALGKPPQILGRNNRPFANPMEYMRFNAHVKLQAGLIGHPDAQKDVCDLMVAACGGLEPRLYEDTFDAAYTRLDDVLKAWKLANPKPRTELDDYLNPEQESEPVAPKPAEKTEQHWIEVDPQRKLFWGHVNGRKGKNEQTRVLSTKEWQALVHEILSVSHMDEYPGNPDDACAEFNKAYDERYPQEPPKDNADDATKQAPTPEELAKPLLAEFLKEFKALRPDVTDKDVALKLVFDVFGGTVTQSVIDVGTDSTRKLWAENKHMLTDKPADPPAKQNGNGNGSKPLDSSPEAHKLTEAEVRAKYTMVMSHYDKKKQKDVLTEYLQVAGRILLFRLKYPQGSILTELIQVNEQGAILKAQIVDENRCVLSTGHAYAGVAGSEKFSGRYLEKAETSAIGRALGAAGFGTDEADFDDSDFLADSPVESK